MKEKNLKNISLCITALLAISMAFSGNIINLLLSTICWVYIWNERNNDTFTIEHLGYTISSIFFIFMFIFSKSEYSSIIMIFAILSSILLMFRYTAYMELLNKIYKIVKK